MLHGGVGNRAGRLAAQGHHRDAAAGHKGGTSVVERICAGALIDGLGLVGHEQALAVRREGDHVWAHTCVEGARICGRGCRGGDRQVGLEQHQLAGFGGVGIGQGHGHHTACAGHGVDLRCRACGGGIAFQIELAHQHRVGRIGQADHLDFCRHGVDQEDALAACIEGDDFSAARVEGVGGKGAHGGHAQLRQQHIFCAHIQVLNAAVLRLGGLRLFVGGLRRGMEGLHVDLKGPLLAQQGAGAHGGGDGGRVSEDLGLVHRCGQRKAAARLLHHVAEVLAVGFDGVGVAAIGQEVQRHHRDLGRRAGQQNTVVEQVDAVALVHQRDIADP